MPQGRAGLHAAVRGLAIAILIASYLRRRGAGAAVGAGLIAWRAWIEAAAATLALGLAVGLWAAAASGPFDEPDLALLSLSAPALGLWMLRRLALALIQQAVLQLFLWPVARQVLRSDWLTTAVVASVFGLFHLPSLSFAVATALAAALWLTLYRRSRRLLPLVVSHAVLAAGASLLPEGLLYDMAVGRPALEIAADLRSLAGAQQQAMLGAVTSARYARHRGRTDSGYVRGLYRDILGRLPGDEEVADGVEQLRTISRLALAKRMLLSRELDDATLWHRHIDDEPLAPGVAIPAGSEEAEFVGWYAAESAWRWAREAAPAIRFRLEREARRDYVLAFRGGAAAPLSAELELNGHVVGDVRLQDLMPRDHRFVVAAEHLGAGGENELRFRVSGAPAVPPGESRALGLGLRQVRLAPLRWPSAAILFADDDYFLTGFSVAEERLRWTQEPLARLIYPLPTVVPEACYVLQLSAGAFERQAVGLSLNGQPIGELTLDGLEPQRRCVRFESRLLRPGPNLVAFRLPGARRPAGDPRELGLALIALRIYPSQDCS